MYFKDKTADHFINWPRGADATTTRYSSPAYLTETWRVVRLSKGADQQRLRESSSIATSKEHRLRPTTKPKKMARTMHKVTIITPEETNKTFKSVHVQTEIWCDSNTNNNNHTQSHKMSLQTNEDPVSL